MQVIRLLPGANVWERLGNVVIHSLPPSTERKPLFIVGDVHACADELAALLQRAKKIINDFQLVCVGDLFTKGPDPVGVFELLSEHNALATLGNHDWALMSSIVHASRRGIQTLPEHTQQTLHMIRFHKRVIFDYLRALPHAIRTEVFPASGPLGGETSYPMIIVHAGYDVSAGLEKTSERMLLTVRYVRWEGSGTERKLALVPSGRADKHPHESTHARMEKFRWHELHEGPELVVFGHDAKQGLFRKTLPSGRPICVGIDTGCTYGRCLTGYFPELDDAIQENARRTYFDMSKNRIISQRIARSSLAAS